MRLGLGAALPLSLAFAAFAVFAAFAPSCLPSLSAVPDAAADAALDASSALCGNGYIDDGEACDPGDAGDGGEGGAASCTSHCQINCPPGMSAGFVDPTTNHCYFLLPPTLTATYTNNQADDSKDGCKAPSYGGHIVTIGSEAEYMTVTGNLVITPYLGKSFWVGLHSYGDAGNHLWISQNTSNEPGWAGGGFCPGCYVHVTPPTALAFPFADVDAGLDCVLDTTGSSTTWFGAACVGEPVHVLCEREPVGSRARPCGVDNQDYCITLPPAISTKVYEYHSLPVDAASAEATCTSSVDAGAVGSLVVFGSQQEREELAYQLRMLDADLVGYWIGLSRTDGTNPSSPWTWDDGTPLGSYPSPWGLDAPETPGSTRAYVSLTTPMAVELRLVDTQLAHSASMVGMGTLPFVCQR